MRHVVCVLMIIGLLSGCTRAEKDQTTSLSFSLGDIGANATSSLSEMNCFGVFVSAPEKEWQKYSCSYATETVSNNGGFSYGTFYGPFYRPKGASGSQLKIEVPNGSDRVLRLIGVKVDTTSGGGLAVTDESACVGFSRTYMDSFYNIAESKPLQLKGEDLSVDLTAVFDSSNEIPIPSCTSFRNEEVAGTPVRLAVQVQDNRVSASNKFISSSNCVGVKFQLQDAFGKPAVSSAAIAAQVRENVLGASIGSFYYPAAASGLDLCAAVNLAPVNDGKVALNFAAGTTDNILYFKPHAIVGGTITISASAATLKTGGSDYVTYVGGTRFPSKYAFYDLFNNISSVKSTTSTPAGIRRGECRFGAVQFLDQYAVPFERSTSSPPPDTIRVSTIPAGVVDFYSSQSACASNSGGSSFYDLDMAPSSSATGFGFFYKVLPGAPSAISFEVRNRALTPYPVITSGDLTQGDNLWQISN